MKKIILNQKSYLSYDEMTNFIKQYEKLDKTKYDFILFPPVVYLSLFKDKPYKVGTQNFFSYNYGSFTGEISLEQLKSMNIKYTLVSHPERKKIIGESYEIAKEKLYKSLSSKFNTILFIGELSKMRNPISYIKKELNYYLRDIEENNIKYLSICYEPYIMGVSTEIKDYNRLKKIIDFIKEYISKKYDENINVFYGGNVTKENIKEILEITNGILLGKASTSIDTLKEVIKEIK